jgi:hypothetical protein
LKQLFEIACFFKQEASAKSLTFLGNALLKQAQYFNIILHEISELELQIITIQVLGFKDV